jgi:hypothetical protein
MKMVTVYNGVLNQPARRVMPAGPALVSMEESALWMGRDSCVTAVTQDSQETSAKEVLLNFQTSLSSLRTDRSTFKSKQKQMES